LFFECDKQFANNHKYSELNLFFKYSSISEIEFLFESLEKENISQIYVETSQDLNYNNQLEYLIFESLCLKIEEEKISKSLLQIIINDLKPTSISFENKFLKLKWN
jgi:hypothetical protein